MDKKTKNIFGIAGLIGVAAMTAFAASLPGPEASAESASTSVTYSVYVHEKTATTIQAPEDGATFTDSVITVNSDYSDATKLNYYLTYTSFDGETTQTYLVRTWCPAHAGDCSQLVEPLDESDYATGTDTFTIDLDEYGGFGKYVLQIKGDGSETASEDSVSFVYSTIVAEDKGTNGDGNQNIYVHVASNVKKVTAMVYDKDGSPLFDEPQEVAFNADGTLDLSTYGLASGEYQVHFWAYDAAGQLAGEYDLTINYVAPDSIAVPNTGAASFIGSVFSSSDMMITGFIALGLVLLFSLRFLKKRKN
jgi:hypothetical protein